VTVPANIFWERFFVTPATAALSYEMRVQQGASSLTSIRKLRGKIYADFATGKYGFLHEIQASGNKDEPGQDFECR
jgi:hypothetical protein